MSKNSQIILWAMDRVSNPTLRSRNEKMSSSMGEDLGQRDLKFTKELENELHEQYKTSNNTNRYIRAV
jgi:hypothetical protein